MVRLYNLQVHTWINFAVTTKRYSTPCTARHGLPTSSLLLCHWIIPRCFSCEQPTYPFYSFCHVTFEVDEMLCLAQSHMAWKALRVPVHVLASIRFLLNLFLHTYLFHTPMVKWKADLGVPVLKPDTSCDEKEFTCKHSTGYISEGRSHPKMCWPTYTYTGLEMELSKGCKFTLLSGKACHTAVWLWAMPDLRVHISLSAYLLQYSLLSCCVFFMHKIIVTTVTVRMNVAIRNTPPAVPATMGTMFNPGEPWRNREDGKLQYEQLSWDVTVNTTYTHNGKHSQQYKMLSTSYTAECELSLDGAEVHCPCIMAGADIVIHVPMISLNPATTLVSHYVHLQ